jgi:hypothetical protein
LRCPRKANRQPVGEASAGPRRPVELDARNDRILHAAGSIAAFAGR